jgi:predicted RNA-binding protein YlxR (DUF448 family)
VLDERHQPLLDRPQTAPGRGAYLCGPGCLAAAIKKKAFYRAFKKGLAVSETLPASQQAARATPVLDTTNLEADLQTKR